MSKEEKMKKTLEETEGVFKKAKVKPGFKTSEFWGIVGTVVAAIIMTVFKVGESHWAVMLATRVVPILAALGYAAIRGSLKKEGLKILEQLVKELKEGK